jgi:hypothetical protein
MKEPITYIDPPMGHLYGFPKKLILQDGETIKDFLIKYGYPEEYIEIGLKYYRTWEEVKE